MSLTETIAMMNPAPRLLDPVLPVRILMWSRASYRLGRKKRDRSSVTPDGLVSYRAVLVLDNRGPVPLLLRIEGAEMRL